MNMLGKKKTYLRDEEQFTFLQEGSNRILSKVQKSFWSCTHVNSCQKLHIINQSTYFIDYFIQASLKIQESRKFIKSLKG